MIRNQILFFLILLTNYVSGQEFLSSQSELQNLISITGDLMDFGKVEIRDTWKGWDGFNYDDFYTNGNEYGGKKLIKIIWKELGYSENSAKKVYSIPNFKSVAYDNVSLYIPKRLSKFKHPIIHELVHFLQHNTLELDKKYLSFNGSNYIEYISQKLELEAHYIQILYIYKYELEIFNLNREKKRQLKKQIKSSFKDTNCIIDLILYAREIDII